MATTTLDGKTIAIPETQADLEELMNDTEKVGALMAAGRFQEVVAKYAEITDKRGELAAQVAEQVSAILAGQETIKSTVGNEVKDQMKTILGEFGVSRPGAASAPGTGADLNAAYNPLAPGVAMNEVGFASLGDFARAVWHKNPRKDERRAQAQEVMNAFSSVEPSAGGFLIPETMRSEIMQLAIEGSIVRQRATVITMSSLTQLMPYVDSTTNVGSVFGGMIFYWTPESGDITMTEAKFGRLKLEANKLTGGAAVPNELWADAPALSSWLMQALPRGLAFFEDLAFFTGTGAGEPQGILNAAATVVVAAEGGQTADTIVLNNVLNMYSRCLPSSLPTAVWVTNQTTFTELMTLSLPVGTGGSSVALVDIRSQPFATMLGRPLIITEKVPVLGDQGDLNLLDFSYYLVGDRQAVSMETSEHARFLNDETLLRVISRVDGRPWIQSAFQPVNGDTVSPFVTLAAR
ncbi:MAG TPA: phage major capsid protein [Dehalococcoidia bacterium]|nr:phage major capsid protein [Dehalococcoidia bacterium]